MTIRSMTEADLPSVLEIEIKTQYLPWSKASFLDCIKPGYENYVIDDGAIKTFAVMSLAADEAHILSIATEPEFQRRGHATTLLTCLIDVVKQRQMTTLFLEVRESNFAAITLYKKLGFCEIGVRSKYYSSKDDREDALIMALDL
jgi:[ribosomal protein S18]-alanine N-acetyltransferase